MSSLKELHNKKMDAELLYNMLGATCITHWTQDEQIAHDVRYVKARHAYFAAFNEYQIALEEQK